MGKFLNSFLEFKNEADATRKFALFAVVIITFGLASLSVTGIVATANWTLLSALPIIGMIVAVLGAELLATVAFIRTLTASTKLRKVAGAFIFIGLAAIGVHNAENGAHVVWPDRFEESAGSLAAKGALSQTTATDIKTARSTAVADIPKELTRVRDEIAKLEVFTRKMSAQTPEGIKEAQTEMIPRCGYTGQVDGIRSTLTESAMRSCGEQIRGELATLRQRETNLLGGQPLGQPQPVAGVTPPVDPALAAIEFNDKASAAFWAWAWLIIMLCVLEGARSLSLWALITDISSRDAQKEREHSDTMADLRRQNEIAAMLAERVKVPPAPEPEPVIEIPPVAEPEPVAAQADPEPLELNDPLPEPAPVVDEAPVNQGARKGGKNAGLMKAAAKAARNRVLILADRSEAQVLKAAE